MMSSWHCGMHGMVGIVADQTACAHCQCSPHACSTGQHMLLPCKHECSACLQMGDGIVLNLMRTIAGAQRDVLLAVAGRRG